MLRSTLICLALVALFGCSKSPVATDPAASGAVSASAAQPDSAAQKTDQAAPLFIENLFLTDDGQWLATGNHSNIAMVWNSQTGQASKSFSHMDWVRSVFLTSDARWLVTGSNDRMAAIWDVQTGKRIHSLQHGESVVSVSMSQDRNWVATATYGGNLLLWNGQTGEFVRTFPQHTGTIWTVCLTDDGQKLLSVTDKDQAFLWDSQTGESLQSFNSYGTQHGGNFLSADGSRLVLQVGVSQADIWNISTGEIVHQIVRPQDSAGVPRQLKSLSLSRNGQWLACEGGKSITLFNAQTGEEIRTFETQISYFSSISLANDGQKLAVVAIPSLEEMKSPDGNVDVTRSSGRVVLFNPQNGDELRTIK